jgi:SAM-dependent methyltransferase
MTDAREPDAGKVRAHYAQLAAQYDAGANRACNEAYRTLAARAMRGRHDILELGAGSGSLLGEMNAPVMVAADLSVPMLTARPAAPGVIRVAADAMMLPFAAATFDGAYSVNMLEHVPRPRAVVDEAARVLRPAGTLMLITPNGGVAWLLELLERLHLKLPEGPHRFLTAGDLRALAAPHFHVRALRRFLAFPAGPPGLVRVFDRAALGHGLFLYAEFERRR